MKYARLGGTGLEVSKVCLGMMSYGSPDWQPWVLPGDEAEIFVRQALDHGINFFDTADFYSLGASEEALGRAVARLTDRSNVVIATKVGLPMAPGANRGGSSRKHIHQAIDASLKRLGTDYVDLYQLHKADPLTPIEETMDALTDVVRAGKALFVGATNFSAWQLAEAACTGAARGSVRFVSMQVQYNLAFREEERDTIPFCVSQGIGVTVYSPLGRGWLAGNRLGRAGMTAREAVRATRDAKAHASYGSEGDVAILQRLLEVAEERGVPASRLALAWLHARPAVDSVLCGALEAAHLDEAVAAVDLILTDAEIHRLEEVYTAQPLKDDGLAVVQKGMKAG